MNKETKQPEVGEFVKELKEQHQIIKYDLRFRPAAIEENREDAEHYHISLYCLRIERCFKLIGRQAEQIAEAKKEIEELKKKGGGK